MNLVAQVPAHAQTDQRIDGCEKCSQRFARPRRRRDQRVIAGTDCRPGLDLRLGRRRVGTAEPARYRRMETIENVQILSQENMNHGGHGYPTCVARRVSMSSV